MVEIGEGGYLEFSKKTKIKPTRRQDAKKVFQLMLMLVQIVVKLIKYFLAQSVKVT